MFKKLMLGVVLILWLFSYNVNALGDITKESYKLETIKITPWMAPDSSYTTEQNFNFLLWTIIQKLMMVLWSISLFIMTIWTWYIILNAWQDELLSKWKTIVMSGIYALIVSIGSYYLVAILSYILYNEY